MKKFIFILALVSLACGIPVAVTKETANEPLPVVTVNTGDVTAKAGTPLKQAIVCAENLNVRLLPGQWNPTTREPLERGNVVLLTGKKETPEGGVWEWWETSEGWVNSFYLCP